MRLDEILRSGPAEASAGIDAVDGWTPVAEVPVGQQIPIAVKVTPDATRAVGLAQDPDLTFAADAGTEITGASGRRAASVHAAHSGRVRGDAVHRAVDAVVLDVRRARPAPDPDVRSRAPHRLSPDRRGAEVRVGAENLRVDAAGLAASRGTVPREDRII